MQACKTGSPTNVDFDYGGRMTEIALLGTIAARSARFLQYDAGTPAISNDKEANAWINPPYRDGWSL